MTQGKLAHFIEFLKTNDRVFRYTVFYFPAATAIGVFLIRWLIRGEGIFESFITAILFFPLPCIFGLMIEAKRRGKLG